MTAPLLERVLACTTLPSLPAVALEVLELSSNPEARLAEIAATVQNDQALSGKILKTVNSSFYGLARPCPSIDRALAYLGLSTVKSLVLGFSLVDCFRQSEIGGFNLISFWRRAVYSAAGARLLAADADWLDPEEAFIAALLQDVGVLAMHIALGTDYDAVIARAEEHHERQATIEMEVLGFNHMTVGAELATRWRLPAEVVSAIRHHHAPERAPAEHRDLLRIVSAAACAAAAMGEKDDAIKVNRFVARVREWFDMDRPAAFDVFRRLGEGATELGRLFSLDTGEPPDIVGILGRANELMLQHQMQIEREATALRQTNDQLARQSITDALTGAANRKHFDETLQRFFEEATSSGKTLSLLFIDADRFKNINDTRGHQAGDAVLAELAQRLGGVVRATDLVFRYGGEEFAVLVPRADSHLAAGLGERLRRRVHDKLFQTGPSPDDQMAVTISVGVATFDPRGARRIAAPAELVRAADEALYAAKQLGRNRVVIHDEVCAAEALAEAEAAGAGEGGPRARHMGAGGGAPGVPDRAQVLLIEDNHLAATVIAKAMESSDAVVYRCATAEDGLAILAGDQRVDLVLSDLNLPGMSAIEMIQAIRAGQRHAATAIVIITASEDPADRAACLGAGANAFITKARFCEAPERWATQIMDIWVAPRKAG